MVVVVAPRHQLHAAVAFVAVSLMACCCCCTKLGVDDSGCAAAEVEFQYNINKNNGPTLTLPFYSQHLTNSNACKLAERSRQS